MPRYPNATSTRLGYPGHIGGDDAGLGVQFAREQGRQAP